MKAAIQTLGHVLYTPNQYVIPVFQRNYRWERPQWDKLWVSLSEIQQPDKIGNHFMGFLVFVQGGVAQPGQNTRFHLIDGQQRLTTTSLLLAAVRNVAQRLQQGELAQEVHDYYLVHPLKKGDNRYRLLPKAQDHDAYLAIIEGKDPPSGRMADALAYFEGELDLLSAQYPEGLRSVFETVCQRLEFMCATLESENAYSIFKSLNSTGVPLGQSDLIRNFVFMHVHPDEQDDFDRDHWTALEAMFASAPGRLDEERFSRFFRDVLMSDGRYVQPKDTFATFEARNEATGFDPVELADGLVGHARHYSIILGESKDQSIEVTFSLAELNRLESSTAYPLLLSMFAKRETGRMSSTELSQCIDMLRGFIFRRFIAGESSRGYGQMFVRAIESDAEHPLEAIEQYLLARGWPHDARFVEAFTLFPLYKRGYAREVLETLERARGHKELAGLDLAQIEHVMPQTLSPTWIEDLGEDPERVHADWLHRPGNLTLSAYNQEVGNQPFAVKRARFADSNIGLTRELAAEKQWSEDEILARGLRMAKEAVVIWNGPKEPYAGDEVALQIQETRVTRFAFWSGFATHLAHKHPELPAFEPAYKRGIRLKSGVKNVLVETRYKVQEDLVALDVYFSQKALKLWSGLREAPQHVESLVGGEPWTFEKAPKSGYAWMTMERTASTSDPAHWPAMYGWLGQKLAQLYGLVLPYLKDELHAFAPASHEGNQNVVASQVLETRASRLAFWTGLAEHLAQNHPELDPIEPIPKRQLRVRSGVPYVSIDLRFKVKEHSVSLDVYFHRKALTLWSRVRENSNHIDSLMSERWIFEQAPKAGYAWISLERVAPTHEPVHWPALYLWLGQKLADVHAHLLPFLTADLVANAESAVRLASAGAGEGVPDENN